MALCQGGSLLDILTPEEASDSEVNPPLFYFLLAVSLKCGMMIRVFVVGYT